MKAYALAAVSAACVLAAPASAAPVSITFNAGTVSGFSTTLPPFNEFVQDEAILVAIVTNDALIDMDTASDAGLFLDPTGTMTLTGESSGTVFTIMGLQFQADSPREFEIDGIDANRTAGQVAVNDIDLEFPDNVLSDPNSFGRILSDLGALDPFLNVAEDDAGIGIVSTDPSIIVEVLEFGPVPEEPDFTVTQAGTPAAVPLPASVLLLGTGLGALSLSRRLKRAKG